MTDLRKTFPEALKILAKFILAHKTWPPHSDDLNNYVHDHRYIINALNGYASGRNDDEKDECWSLKAQVLEMFLRKAPELRDIVSGISLTSANASDDATFDPLTWRGFNDVLQFIHGGLLDDLWLAHYRRDGVARIVGETIDDAIQGGKEIPVSPRIRAPDRNAEWFRGAERTYLDRKSFQHLFSAALQDVDPHVPSMNELNEIWRCRPYGGVRPGASG